MIDCPYCDDRHASTKDLLKNHDAAELGIEGQLIYD
jgi:hypothetical protein